LHIRIPCSIEDHFSGLWISQQKSVPIWSACAILSQSPPHTTSTSISCQTFSLLFATASALCSRALFRFLCDCVENLLPFLQPWVKSIVVALQCAGETSLSVLQPGLLILLWGGPYRKHRRHSISLFYAYSYPRKCFG
jgi:hypothetical protein